MNFIQIEKKWKKYWKKYNTFEVTENIKKKKFYILNMFPYPSGSGLHVGHCMAYIASDIYSRYKNAKGFNVLNPMGFDSFGLPAEQYAIKTGKNPYFITKENEKRYQIQMERLGISFDWKRKISTANPSFYKWTQWMFIQIFNSWYDERNDKSMPIDSLIDEFNKNGNMLIKEKNILNKEKFDSNTWKNFNSYKKELILQNYRLAYLKYSIVNWCPDLNTVLANEEIENKKSIRGGYSIYKRKMLQWHIRISSYADRLIKGLNSVKCSNSLKKSQINWIGKSKIFFIKLKIFYVKKEKYIKFFLPNPEMIFGITFISLSKEHPFNKYIIINKDSKKNTKNGFGFFTGNYVIHPFTKKKIPIFISDFFFTDMNNTNNIKSFVGIPGHNEKSKIFSEKFNLKKILVLNNKKICINSFFLNGLNNKQARKKIIEIMIKKRIGGNKICYKIRDAIFSRQRYWGEPIPIYYKNNTPIPIPTNKLPIFLPKIENYHPIKGKSALSRVKKWAWNEKEMKITFNKYVDQKNIFPIETSTMPSWAGSSWYFLRYMDVNNNKFFVEKNKKNYWNNVDLYIGGAEHNTGHLIYARFWNKFLKDRGWINEEEPFKKIINQGMILNKSAVLLKVIGMEIFVSYGLKIKKSSIFSFQEIYIDTILVNKKNHLNINEFKKCNNEFYNPIFILEKGLFLCGRKMEKMSKSKYNVINPDNICKKYGTDVFRIHEMFMGPINQKKIWDDKKINGAKNFIKKLWNLFHKNEVFSVSRDTPKQEELKILHYTIKKIEEKINSFSFNTCISYLMICINKLTLLKCNKKKILKPLLKITSLFSPYISEEIWRKLGYKKSIFHFKFPNYEKKYIENNVKKYLVMFNGKLKFIKKFDSNLRIDEIKINILSHFMVKKIKNKIKKIIIIPNKVINILY